MLLRSPGPAWAGPRMTAAAEEVARRAAAPHLSAQAEDPSILEDRFVQAINSNDWTKISAADWRAITFRLWKSPLNLLSTHRFHFNYRRFLDAERSARTIKCLIHVYLESYDPNLEGMEWVGGMIRKILAQRRFVVLEHWSDMDREFQLFSTAPGPRYLAVRCLEHPQSALLPHRRASLDTPELASSGFAREAYLQAIRLMSDPTVPSPRATLRLERFLEWSKGDPGRAFIRFPQFCPQLLSVLLSRVPDDPNQLASLRDFFHRYARAWQRHDTSCADPDAAQQEAIQNILTIPG